MFSGKGAWFCVWQFGQVVWCWLYFVVLVCIWMSILYRVLVWVLGVFVRLVWHVLQVVGFRFMVWLGVWVIFRPWPLWFFWPPGFLLVGWCLVWGRFHLSLEGGMELFWLFWFVFASRAAILRANSCICSCRAMFWFISSSLLSFSNSALVMVFSG